MATRRELIQAIRGRYHAAARHDKKKILDEFIEVTGFHRKHAIRTLRRSAVTEAHRSTGCSAVAPAMERCRTGVDDSLGGRRPHLWEAVEVRDPDPVGRNGATRSSPAESGDSPPDSHGKRGDDRQGTGLDQADRSARPSENEKPLRKSIGIRTFADWNDPAPGFFEMDMVAHCGKSVAGSHVHSLVLTDIASAWTVAAAMVVREQTLAKVTVENIRKQLPFPLLSALDVDNDTARLSTRHW